MTVAGKAYDGTTVAVASVGTLNGLVGGEQLGVTATGTFDGANAGQHATLVVFQLADGANGGLGSNYVLGTAQVTGIITPKALTVTGTSVAGKAYDGSTGAAVTAGTLDGLVGAETLTIADVTGTFDCANAGQRSATVNYALANGSNGGLASNYVLAPVAVSARIAPKALTTTGTTVADRAYDGTMVANATAGTLQGLVGIEQLGVTAMGAFDGANAGQHTATFSYALADGANGGMASNYALAPMTIDAAITPKLLTVTGTTVVNRAYDCTTIANATAGTLQGLVGN